jgi:hypothetical protein
VISSAERAVRAEDGHGAVGGHEPVVVRRIAREGGDRGLDGDRVGARAGVDLRRHQAVAGGGAVLEVVGRRGAVRIDAAIEVGGRLGERVGRAGDGDGLLDGGLGAGGGREGGGQQGEDHE